MSRRVLHLASPPMHGQDVRDVQWLLNGKNPSVWGPGGKHKPPIFYHLDVDGAFGARTATCCERAQHWLGYEHPQQQAGQDFHDFMTGAKKLTKDMQHRRGKRIRAAAHHVSRKGHAVEALRAHLGLGESPAGSNHNFITAWYGFDGPWCAMSCSWGYHQAGINWRYSYVPAIVSDARLGRNHMLITGSPVKGDVFITPGEQHVGFFDKWGTGGYFHTVEGNHGDEVAADLRHRSSIMCFVRVNA